MNTQKKHLTKIQNLILKSMEDNGTNWLKPWAAKAAEGFPYNGISKRPYNGFNPFLLSAVALAEGYKSSQWATYKQWTDKGGSLAGAKGKGVPVFYWSVKKYKDKNDLDEGGKPKEKTGFLFKNYIVFNKDVVEGLKDNDKPLPEPVNIFDDKKVNQFIENTKAVINYGGGRACYNSVTDKISMPHASDFKGTKTSTPLEAFYSTLLHELVHWTGHSSRLNRKLGNGFGSIDYAFEELIAETGAVILSIQLGVSPEPRADHAQYLNGWKSVIKKDPKAIYSAFSKAGKAAKFLEDLQPLDFIINTKEAA